jgi:hypothetical protein
MQIELTNEQASNLIALLNRVQISGSEAEVVLVFKQKLSQAALAEQRRPKGLEGNAKRETLPEIK